MTMKAHHLLMLKLDRIGPERATVALYASIENGWVGVFPEKTKPARAALRAAEDNSSDWAGYENVEEA